MPMYSYICKKCKNTFDELYQTQSEVEETESKVKCPKCNSTKKERQFPAGTSFSLRGSGWAKQRYQK